MISLTGIKKKLNGQNTIANIFLSQIPYKFFDLFSDMIHIIKWNKTRLLTSGMKVLYLTFQYYFHASNKSPWTKPHFIYHAKIC